ncbi:MAG: DUF72 domain-containing protein [Candidatus Omnitrophota bacterium]
MHRFGSVYIGTSGWYYQHWYGKFYPTDLAKKELLSYYCRHFDTVELNNSFYSLPSENAVNCWRDNTGKEFLFSVKASRLITHYKRLKNSHNVLQSFLKRMSLLENKLGPVLFQLPSTFSKDITTLKKFITVLPDKLQKVIEFREKSWICNEVFKVLKKYNVAFCTVSMPNFPVVFEKTADFSYMRFHGSEALYGSCYSEEELCWFAKKIQHFLLKDKSATYIYFNNDNNAYAVHNALYLKQLLFDTD